MAVRQILLILSAAVLAACSSGEGTNRIVSAAFEQLRPQKPDPNAPKPPPLTRAAIDATGTATILSRLFSDLAPSLLTAASDNGGYVTYISRFSQSLTLRGSLITASRGMGHDLLAVEAAATDPLVRATPLSRWPAQVRRTYHFPDFSPEGRRIAVTCRFEPEQELEIEIVQVTHRGRQVAEYCVGDGTEFKNLHFVADGTGFVWRSLQWLGPAQGSTDLQIVEPYTP